MNDQLDVSRLIGNFPDFRADPGAVVAESEKESPAPPSMSFSQVLAT